MKRAICLAAVLAAALLLGACSTYLTTSLTYQVDTGDSIVVTVDAKAGYTQDGENPFTISKDGEGIMAGAFMTLKDYESYAGDFTTQPPEGVTVLEQGEKDGNEYVFFQYEGETGTGYNYVLKVKDAKTAIMLGSEASHQEAESCFQALTFAKE